MRFLYQQLSTPEPDFSPDFANANRELLSLERASSARPGSPLEVVRHDRDDPYLVVAADKGTATFSDIANAIAAEYGFWLGDAFASAAGVFVA